MGNTDLKSSVKETAATSSALGGSVRLTASGESAGTSWCFSSTFSGGEGAFSKLFSERDMEGSSDEEEVVGPWPFKGGPYWSRHVSLAITRKPYVSLRPVAMSRHSRTLQCLPYLPQSTYPFCFFIRLHGFDEHVSSMLRNRMTRCLASTQIDQELFDSITPKTTDSSPNLQFTCQP